MTSDDSRRFNFNIHDRLVVALRLALTNRIQIPTDLRAYQEGKLARVQQVLQAVQLERQEI